MTFAERPIIVGAGPVGLGAALFLAHEGRYVRLLDMRSAPSIESKALAVNPRTLQMLEPTGVTERMLKLGLPIRGVQFHGRDRLIGSISLDGFHPKYPFMLALSQAATERLLSEALAEAGGEVERGKKMVDCRNVDAGVEVEFASDAGNETARGPWLLAADGAHSVARQKMGIDFPGSAFSNQWHLVDVPLHTHLPEDRAHIIFLEEGSFLFIMRVVADARGPSPAPLWRVLGNRPELLSQTRVGEPAGPPIWTSSFKVSHRINASLAAGNVFFAGDAAHLHSPAGARGMNLGLEDAWVFANLVRTNRLSEYSALRHPVDHGVVRRVELISRLVSGESGLFRFARTNLFPLAIRVPFVRRRMLQTVGGLDHALPRFASAPAPVVAANV